ncbi:UNVERIFIED_CONTAM: hypothetical protein K2H54_069801 [Gekko kuhli]
MFDTPTLNGGGRGISVQRVLVYGAGCLDRGHSLNPCTDKKRLISHSLRRSFNWITHLVGNVQGLVRMLLFHLQVGFKLCTWEIALRVDNHTCNAGGLGLGFFSW